ncbi:sensor histidine kinase [Microvirga arabica]|uniref:sensor histidine kinase n=1 Tax=Microvirga arabica TaxID=1128671 RepID=UPI001939A3DE|nr:sensor histidine kinase [Microvirga arabica]MBM1175247.1 CHASE3 domain-containing protein [Microvirga arabica]
MILSADTPMKEKATGRPPTSGQAPARSSRFKRSIGAFAFTLAGALLVASAITLNVLLSGLTETRTLVLRTGSILRDAAELHVDIRSAETGQRGYLLTGERRYLTPYERAIGQVWSTFQRLQQAVQDSGQVTRLAGLRPLIEAKLEELGRTVELRGRSFEEALAVVRTDVGQKLMEDIEAAIAEFERAEQEIMVSRTRELEQRAVWTTRVAAVSGVLALISAILGVIWIGRQRANARLLDAEQRFRQDLERKVEERTAQLSQANRELDAFAYTISHDLRAPLRAMHGYAGALVEDYGSILPEEGHRFTDRIVSAAERMEVLIEDILTYSRLAREEVSVRPVDLEATVEKVIANAEPIIREAKARVEVEPPLPDVMAHAPTLAQVMDNLLSNAIKFIPSGQTPHVSIRAEESDGRVRLWVEDNGIGIDPAHQERVFQPFQRLHGVESYPGTGIGLAIVRRSIERMGGRSGVISEPGQGSRFWIELRSVQREPTI